METEKDMIDRLERKEWEDIEEEEDQRKIIILQQN